MTQKKGLPIFIYIAGAALAAAVVRFFQYLMIVDFETGFFIEGSGAGAALLRGLLVAVTVLLGVFCIFGEKKEWTAFTIASDGLGDKTSLYLGAVYLAAAAFSLWETAGLFGAGQAAGEAPAALIAVLSVLQTAVLAVTGFLMMKSRVMPALTGGLQVIPALVFLTRAIVLFAGDLIIKSRSDSLIVLLTYVFGAMFFTASAHCYARLESRHSRLREIVAAGLTFIFSVLHVLPKLLMYLFGGSLAAGMDAIDKNVICLLLASGGFLCTVFLTTQRKAIEYIVTDDEKEKEGEQPTAAESEETNEE